MSLSIAAEVFKIAREMMHIDLVGIFTGPTSLVRRNPLAHSPAVKVEKSIYRIFNIKALSECETLSNFVVNRTKPVKYFCNLVCPTIENVLACGFPISDSQ